MTLPVPTEVYERALAEAEAAHNTLSRVLVRWLMNGTPTEAGPTKSATSGLQPTADADRRTSKSKRFRVEPFNSAFRPGVDPLRLNQLVDELEADRGTDRER